MLSFTILFIPSALFAQTVGTQGNTSISVPEIVPFVGGKEIVDPRRLLNADELNLEKPEPRINIPGVNFTDPKVYEEADGADGGKQVFIYSTYLGEYIIALYQYAVAIASLLAVIMIIIAGFEWVVSGGNQESIGQAKKRITNAITGLVLAVGSYTILYTINPELVRFRPLKTNYINTYDSSQYLEYYTKGAPANPDLRGSLPAGKSRCAVSDKLSSKQLTCEFIRAVKYLNGTLRRVRTDTNPTFIPTECPLDFYDKRKLAESASIAGQPSLTYNGFDELFKRYSHCVEGLPWTLLKAKAFTESKFILTAKSERDFRGLFQTNDRNCRDALGKYKADSYCSNLENPELSTMVATAMIRESMNIIVPQCGTNIPQDTLNIFLYMRHHSGPGILSYVLPKLKERNGGACTFTDLKQLCEVEYEAWNTVKVNFKVEKSNDSSYCTKADQF